MKPNWIATTTRVVIPSSYPGDDGELTLTVHYDSEGRLERLEGFGYSRDIDARYVKGLAEFLSTLKDTPICPRPAWEIREAVDAGKLDPTSLPPILESIKSVVSYPLDNAGTGKTFTRVE